jgi:hypothetical protein
MPLQVLTDFQVQPLNGARPRDWVELHWVGLILLWFGQWNGGIDRPVGRFSLFCEASIHHWLSARNRSNHRSIYPPSQSTHTHTHTHTGINPFVYKEQHAALKDGEEPGDYEVYVSLTGKEKGLGKNQLAALRNPTK